jgi:hypothetical protein
MRGMRWSPFSGLGAEEEAGGAEAPPAYGSLAEIAEGDVAIDLGVDVVAGVDLKPRALAASPA